MLVSSGCHEIHKEVWSTKSESFDTGEEPWKRRCSENGNYIKTPSSTNSVINQFYGLMPDEI